MIKGLNDMSVEQLNTLREELIEKTKSLGGDEWREYERINDDICGIELELLKRDYIERLKERYNDFIGERDEMLSAAYIQQYELGADDEEYQEDWYNINHRLHELEAMLSAYGEKV